MQEIPADVQDVIKADLLRYAHAAALLSQHCATNTVGDTQRLEELQKARDDAEKSLLERYTTMQEEAQVAKKEVLFLRQVRNDLMHEKAEEMMLIYRGSVHWQARIEQVSELSHLT